MNKKKIIALSLALALTASAGLTACDSATSANMPTGKVNTSDIDSWDDPDISWKKNKDEQVTFDCYIDFDWYGYDSFGENDVDKEIIKRTGVTLNVTKSSDLNQLQVLMAADELPELIFTTNDVTRFYDPDYTYSYNELIDEFAPEMRNLVSETEISNNITDDEGNFYTLRSHYNSDEAWADPRNVPSPGDSGLFYRSDLLAEMGVDSISSIEELEEVFAQAKADYPDLITYLPHPTWLSPFYEYFGISPSPTYVYYDEETGKAQLGLLDEDLEDYYLFLNRCYLNGYLDPEAYTYEPEQYFQIVRSGSVFASSYNLGLADDTNMNYYDANGIDAHLDPQIEPLSYKGETKFAPMDPSVGWAYFFISKNCKNPKKAIEFVEFLKSPEGDALTQWGIEGVHYTLTDDGYLLRPDDYASMEHTGVGPWYFMASGLGEGVAVSSAKVSNPDYSTTVDLARARKEYYQRNPVLAFTAPAADTDEAVILSKIKDLYTNSNVGIITAESQEACSAKVQELIDNCKALGIDQLTEYETAAYEKAAKKYE